jgi:hypothetical protein
MAKPLPSQATDNAADRAHIPTEVPPADPPPPPLTDFNMPDAANIPTAAVNHLPDWFVV